MSKDGFYESREWRMARYSAIFANNGRCELCGRNKHDGVVLHVDHIRPRSLAPHLALDQNNLQVLCADCNLGKGNRDNTDWRAPGHKNFPIVGMISLSDVVAKIKSTTYTDLDEGGRIAMRELLKAKQERDVKRQMGGRA